MPTRPNRKLQQQRAATETDIIVQTVSHPPADPSHIRRRSKPPEPTNGTTDKQFAYGDRAQGGVIAEEDERHRRDALRLAWADALSYATVEEMPALEAYDETVIRAILERREAQMASEARLENEAITGKKTEPAGQPDDSLGRWLSEVDASPPPPRLLDRWDPKGLSILYGPSSVGKGVQISRDTVELVRAGHRPLIVDYESHADEYARRIRALGGPDVVSRVLIVTPLDPAHWHGKSGPLWDIAPRLRQLVQAHDRTIMLVDSLGPACMGMGMNDPDTPQRFTEATQAICPLTIAIGQVNRAGDLSQPFGSVFWRYYSRAMWSAERAPGQARDNLQSILLVDRKANNYARAERLLVRVEWRDGLPTDSEEQIYALALGDQLEVVLGLQNRLTVPEIVDKLNEEVEDEAHKVRADSVRHALRRGAASKPPRFVQEGSGKTARWSI